LIRIKLVPLGDNAKPGIHVVEGKMPPLQGEGCIGGFDSNYLRFYCARPGAWTPIDAQIAELEDALGQSEYRWQWRRNLERYARYYAGVTEGDRRIILGLFETESIKIMDLIGLKPGIYIVSEVEFPGISDGGCNVINVRYDPLDKKLAARCNGH
jgi:hypothetical protein